ncbi:hypothetical protein D769_00170 [Cupriavidus sp. HMR-1]|uniref:hypothetical protein n=1 Tax=Burkholderiaceae TaxID=119060 RepID=UPI0002A1AFC3|nr:MULTISPECIES: hypothetical protein [Burkholderiaceae]ELA01439.1 hypothetical protein D769_00170 [Cupriavidus sp. HMR-1]KVS16396.1 hypothetical protein WK32_26910 [Burkholderia vietnamiensis]
MSTLTLTTKLNARMMAAVILDDARDIRRLAKDGLDVTGVNLNGDTWLDVAVARNKMKAAAAIIMLSGSKTKLLNTIDRNGDTVLDKAVGVVSEKFLVMLLSASDKLNLRHTDSKNVSTLDRLMKLNSKAVNDALARNRTMALAA